MIDTYKLLYNLQTNLEIHAGKLFVKMCRFAVIDHRLKGSHFIYDSHLNLTYLKFAQGFKAASPSRVQLKLSFIHRELEYTEVHYGGSEFVPQTKQRHLQFSALALLQVNTREQFVIVSI